MDEGGPYWHLQSDQARKQVFRKSGKWMIAVEFLFMRGFFEYKKKAFVTGRRPFKMWVQILFQALFKNYFKIIK